MWEDFFEQHVIQDELLAKAYSKTDPRQRSFFKSQIADLINFYNLSFWTKKKEQIFFPNTILTIQHSLQDKVLCLIYPEFLAANQILALLIPFLCFGLKRVGVIFVGKINFVRRYYLLTALELAGISYLACTSIQETKKFIFSEQIKNVYLFGFGPRKKVFAGVDYVWQVPELKKGIILETNDLDKQEVFGSHPHFTFSFVQDLKELELKIKKELFDLIIGAEELYPGSLVLGKGKETSWIWPGVERLLPWNVSMVLGGKNCQ
ncbi:MAG: hypothetical protein Q9M37_04960 [Desulfonauticus sp.]|nr:hypothetical protein [Desulfonauticus sp.]